MNRGVSYGFLVSVVRLLQPASVHAGKGEGPPLPPARDVPVIAAEDGFPNACVDCHIHMKEQDHDVRLSTGMKTRAAQVNPQVLEKARGAAPAGITLTGRHAMTAQSNCPTLTVLPSGGTKGNRTAKRDSCFPSLGMMRG